MPSAGTAVTTWFPELASAIIESSAPVTRQLVQPSTTTGGMISAGSGAWQAANATSPGFSQNAPAWPASHSSSVLQAGSVQLLASALHVPPSAAHAVALQAGVTHSPATQLPPAAWHVAATHVLTQVSPVQLPPAASQLGASQVTVAGGGS
jgi:hypothetical protein